MSLLGLWEVSLTLSAASLAIMAGLIVARFVSERRSRAIAARRQSLVPRLLSGDFGHSDVLDSTEVDDQTTDLLVELLHMVRGDERADFVNLANRIGVTNRLINRLEKGSPRVKVSAAEALANFPEPEVTDALDRALDSKFADVRLTAALALAESNRGPPIKILIERLDLGHSENSLLMISMLQKMATDHSDEIAALILDHDVTASVKAAAIDALSAFGDFKIAPVVNELALQAQADSEELARYLRALGSFRHPAGIPAVVHHLSASAWWVRAAAAEAAGRIGIHQALPQMVALLEDKDWWVRFRAGEALSRMGTEGIQALRMVGIRFGEPARSAARLTLAELGHALDD